MSDKFTPFIIAKRVKEFMDWIALDIYPEEPCQFAMKIVDDMIDGLLSKCNLPPGAKVIDVGCGRGEALEIFKARGLDPIGITLGPQDFKRCEDAGHHVLMADQTFTPFSNGEFDLCWVRHCLEHSPWPLMSLCEFNRILKPGGILYVEVPAPDTDCFHEMNQNHYSVFPPRNWVSLMYRAGFDKIESYQISTEVVAGKDRYMAWIMRKA
jgi:SAM-dependent methyltransferase